MRKKLCLVLAAAMMLGLAACGKTETTEEPTTTQTVTEADATEADKTEADATEAGDTEETTEPEASIPEYSVPDEFTFDGEFKVKILGYEYFDTGEKYEYNIVNIYYDFTNLTEDEFKKYQAVYWAATQDGQDLEKDPNSNITFSNMDYVDNTWIFLQPGVTGRDYVQFACIKDSKSPITVKLGKENENYPYTFDVYPEWEMPDMRAEKFEFEKVPEPAFGPGNITEGANEGRYNIKIEGVKEYSTDNQFNAAGELAPYDIIGIEFTVTNNLDREESPFMLFMNDCYVFQDGVSLNNCGSGKGSVDEGKTQKDLPLYQKLQPGQTATCCVHYKLRSDSKIEVLCRKFVGKEIFLDQVLDVEVPQK